MDEYYCPKCGAVLNDQDGFDPNCGTWVCTECGEQLMDDDIYNNDSFEGVAWYCDKCGALLNRQWLTDDGEVKSVTVNEDKKFAKGDEYRADAEIVITYHTYKKNKQK